MSLKYNFIKYIIFISLLSLLSIGFLNILILESELFQDGNELALGKATKSIYGKSKKGSIHCKGIKDSKKCINYANDFSNNILWIGNSQLHGINQYEEGQVPAPEILFNTLDSQGKNLTTFSQRILSLSGRGIGNGLRIKKLRWFSTNLLAYQSSGIEESTPSR